MCAVSSQKCISKKGFLPLILLQALSETFTPKKREGAGMELCGRALAAFPFIYSSFSHQGFNCSYSIPGYSAGEGNAHSAP